jgi:hypothetical protein
MKLPHLLTRNLCGPIVGCLLLLAGASSPAQTAGENVAQGRFFLSARDLTNAHSRFAAALALDPNHATGNVFYAATRLLTLADRPSGKAFLDRLGFAATNRNVYHWTAGVARDTNGVPLAPANFSASALTAFWRTNVLTEISGAVSNLARVTDTNFTLSLTSNETTTVEVTLDYGDLRMMRSLLQFAQYFSYTLQSWDLEAQLSAIRSLLSSDGLAVETLLADYPNLLNFATTNELGLARSAFSEAVASYLEASQFIRNRAPNLTRLFNLDPRLAGREQTFRQTLSDLRTSLTGTVPLQANSTYSVFLAPHFDGLHPLRSFLPRMHGKGFILGSLPDATFGGLIQGWAAAEVEAALSRVLPPVPFIPYAEASPSHLFSFEINTVKDRGYVIQISTNLTEWSDDSAFVSTGPRHTFTDPRPATSPRRYFRVVDLPLSQMPPPPNDNFSQRAQLNGLNFGFAGYNLNATVEPGEPGIPYNSVWYTWTAPVSSLVEITSTDQNHYIFVSVFTGSSLGSLTPVSNAGRPGQTYPGFSFLATAGITYQIQLSGYPGAIQMILGIPPDVTLLSPLDGTVYLAPTNVIIHASAVASGSPLQELRCYGDSTLLAVEAGLTLNQTWTNVGIGRHFVVAEGLDRLGLGTYASATIYVRPSNDTFASRIPIDSTPATVTGSNDGASLEPGEPNPTGENDAASVWWSWTAPASGIVTMTADLLEPPLGYPLISEVAVYVGSSVTNLSMIAEDSPAYGFTAEVSFLAQQGQAYEIAVAGLYGQVGDITLNIIPTEPPLAAILSPVDGQIIISTGPTNLTIVASASDPDGNIARVDFYTQQGYSLLATLTQSPYTLPWTNVYLGTYSLVVRATDNAGAFSYSDPVMVNVQAPPPANDAFSNFALLTGTNTIATGDNSSASREAGEPFHAGNFGGRSVWWSWTAPYAGTFLISVSSPNVYYPVLAAYTGTTLSSLHNVASTTGSNGIAQLTLAAISGQAYFIALDDSWGMGGAYTLTIAPRN